MTGSGSSSRTCFSGSDFQSAFLGVWAHVNVPLSLRLPDPAHVELLLNVDRAALAVEPGGEPAPCVAAAEGDGREIVEPVEQLQAGQALEHADRE